VAGLACTQEKQPAKAREYLSRGVTLSDDYLDFHFALARLDEQDKDFSDAAREYDRILQDRPDDALTRTKRDALMVKH
jgi:predicted TPR repeat methyltransferase